MPGQDWSQNKHYVGYLQRRVVFLEKTISQALDALKQNDVCEAVACLSTTGRPKKWEDDDIPGHRG
jgi:hypothetical protein